MIIATREAILHALETVGADRDAEGRFVILGPSPFLGADSDTLVVSDMAIYSVACEGQSLAALLAASVGKQAVFVLGFEVN